jgi:hypothetical protein
MLHDGAAMRGWRRAPRQERSRSAADDLINLVRAVPFDRGERSSVDGRHDNVIAA